MNDRDPRRALLTASTLVALFENQLTEYARMSEAERRSTPRGRDLTDRLPGLRQGHDKWVRRRAALIEQIKTEDAQKAQNGEPQ